MYEIEDYNIDKVLNNNRLKNLGIVNMYLIRPAFETLVNTLKTDITNIINSFHQVYVIAFICFFFFLITVYFIIWRPFVNNLDTQVKY